MSSRKLINYLRTYRKRCAFNHHDLVVLLGGESPSTVSRHEAAKRLPDAKHLITYELIFGEPASRIFGGVAEDLTRSLRRNAERLLAKYSAQPSNRRNMTKVAALQRIIDVDEPHPGN